MLYKKLVPLMLLAVLLFAAVPTGAHHSIASAYDFSKPLVLKGTVKDVELINPHSMLRLEVTNADGTTTEWIFQLTSIGDLRRRGLVRGADNPLQIGTACTVYGFAARNGKQMGFMKSVKVADGREIVFWFGDPNG